MWKCIRCGKAIDDQYNVCPFCGAARSAGRFGTTAAQPRPAAFASNEKPAEPSAPQTQYVPDFRHVRAGRGFIILGTALALLLPALVILFAVLRRLDWADALHAFLYPAREAGAGVDALTWILYGVLSLAAALVAALPGLWTAGLGKALRRLNRMEELL
ncbi:MAG: hypothetical protein IJS53_00555 [Clostridia bacterium]|nr:hypothetical protein [Clostridia bacterium]